MLETTALDQTAAYGFAATEAQSDARIVVARGDGIGPEIMQATLRILSAAGARLDIAEIGIGEAVYLSGKPSGIEEQAWAVLRERKILLKAPITTPQGSGYKSLNVTLRKSLGLYANVRPCIAYAPFVVTRHPAMDIVIIRENEEDLYAGIEHRQSDDVYQCLKLVTRQGCERIVRYAFEYARAHGRRKVTCMSKDNIMKMTDGLFHRVFDEIAAEYTDIACDHMIIDIGMARVVAAPEKFDVIVTLNLYGDILSDVAAEMAGSVGLAGSANIGQGGAMFEAIHGTAPDIAGRNLANPSGLLNAAVMMLQHVGQGAVGQRVTNAWLKTLEDGVHTGDIAGEKTTRLVGTTAFADAVIERLGLAPKTLTPAACGTLPMLKLPTVTLRPAQKKEMVGVDVFLQWREGDNLGDPEVLAATLKRLSIAGMRLDMITSRGVKVWPNGIPETCLTDHWRCRFMAEQGIAMNHSMLIQLLSRINGAALDFIKTETLYHFDGKPGFSLGQGQ